MKYRVVMELEFDGEATEADMVEEDIKMNFSPMLEDTREHNPDSPLLKASMVITKEPSE